MNELSPTAAMPVTAARRPFLPPTANSSAAIPMYSLAWLAELERRRSGASMSGVGVASIAWYTAVSSTTSSWNTSRAMLSMSLLSAVSATGRCYHS